MASEESVALPLIDGLPQRPDNYDYLKILKDFLGGDFSKVFAGKVVYPRQLEIHLPGDHKRPCDFDCYYCQGGLLKRPLGMDEPKVLRLLEDIGPAKCEYHIFGGAYTEPLLNPYLMDFLRVTKRLKVSFGIHTNGSRLKNLEEEKGFLTELFMLMDKKDYLSVSLDAGTPESHMKTKNLKVNHFDTIIEGIAMACALQKKNPQRPAVRICYLMNSVNSSEEEIARMVRIAKELGVDSLRFSIPYDQYGKPFARVRDYKQKVEIPQNLVYEQRLKKFYSHSPDDKPYIFYFPPFNQDVDRMNYRHCVYTYYQTTLAADGNMYRCSSIATPSFLFGKLGAIPDNRKEFERLLISSQGSDFNCDRCFKAHARCNRLALEINSAYNAAHDLPI
ncbi:MAG TPA: radical SAM protein [Candidatus Omnitrophota bacterium]|nr:radical SAM protein [Candidatus Omnitrophota bacterium]HPD84872.1 radical SAM protein [Candidatus Omnitrophota bacterium]HRZ03730.1 radical SAM protein [Candidatus Omnitrophota bacterium]